jgi:hypothetical protein
MKLITGTEAAEFRVAWKALSEEATSFFLTPLMVQVVGVKP